MALLGSMEMTTVSLSTVKGRESCLPISKEVTYKLPRIATLVVAGGQPLEQKVD